MKGWGVTLSLASLGLGFQQDHYGLFLVAALSGVAFWALEGTSKLHQMRHYPRVREIEVICFELFRVPGEDGPISSPLLDWGWHAARRSVLGAHGAEDPRTPQRRPDRSRARLPRMRAFLFPHVLLPHAIAIAAGATLFLIGLAGGLGPI